MDTGPWRVAGGLLIVCCCLILPRGAAAQRDPHTTGWMVELTAAANGVTNDAYTNAGRSSDRGFAPLVGLSLAILKRPIRFLSVGLLTYYGFLYPDVPDEVHAFSGFLAVLAEIRGHVPIRSFDPWVGVGFGYTLAHTSLSVAGGEDDATAKMALHGMGIGVGVGFNIFVTDTFALGPFFRMIFGVWPRQCLEIHDELVDMDRECTDVDDPIDPDYTPHFWTAGLTLTSSF